MPVYSSSGKTKQFQSNPGAPNSDSSRSKTNTVDPDAPDANNSQSKTAEVNPDAPLAESGASCSRSANNPGGGPVTQTWIAPGPTAAILSAQNNLGSPLVAGTPITRLPGNTVTTAFAGTGMPTRRADGLVLQFANSGDSVRYVYQGPLVLPDWTVLTGTMLLIPGATYYLGMTPGTLTTTMPTRPSFALLQVVGVALDANTLDVDPDTYEVDL